MLRLLRTSVLVRGPSSNRPIATRFAALRVLAIFAVFVAANPLATGVGVSAPLADAGSVTAGFEAVDGADDPASLAAETTLSSSMYDVAEAQGGDWIEPWLRAFDRDGDHVDDESQTLARNLIESGRGDEAVPMILHFEHPPSAADLDTIERDTGARFNFAFHHIPAARADVPASAIANPNVMPGVVVAEYDRPMSVALEHSAPSTLAHASVAAVSPYDGITAQDMGYDGSGTVIAVVDTGVNNLHEAFPGKWITGFDLTSGQVVPCTDSQDSNSAGHGTHVASTALGNPPNPRKGTAYQARLVEFNIATPGAGVESLGGIAAAFDTVLDYNAAIDAGTPMCDVSTDDRIDVLTLSFGSASRGGPNAGVVEDLVTALVRSGVVVTIAAGNCGPVPSATCAVGDDEATISSPGNAAEAITVAASNDFDTIQRIDDGLAGFSSRGPVSATYQNGYDGPMSGAHDWRELVDRERKPEITAPGVNIVAADSASVSGYRSLSGTSMAAPHVAGISALLVQAGDDVKSQTGGVNLMRPTASTYDSEGDYVSGANPVRDAIIHGANYVERDVPAGPLRAWAGPGADMLRWNNGWGYGLVNATASLCWAWSNVLAPEGAVVPEKVLQICGWGVALGGEVNGESVARKGEPMRLVASVTGGMPPFATTWDLDGDGAFDDGSGLELIVSPAFTDAWPVRARVSDRDEQVMILAHVLDVKRPLGEEQHLLTVDFDSPSCEDTGGWLSEVTEDGSPSESWRIRAGSADSGMCAWSHTASDAGYASYLGTSLTSPASACFAVPTTMESARLNVRLRGLIDAQPYDVLHLQARDGCGDGAWQTLRDESGVKGDTAYEDSYVDISDLAGAPPFQLRFWLEGNINNGCGPEGQPICPGYMLDTVTITGRDAGQDSPFDSSPPTIPNDLIATYDDPRQAVSLVWKPATDNVGIAGYNVYRSTTAGPTVDPGNLVGHSVDNSFLDLGRVGSAMNHYVVTAVDAATNEGGPSNEASVSVPADRTPMVQDLIANASLTRGQPMVDLTWLGVPAFWDLDHYNVYRWTTGPEGVLQENLVATTREPAWRDLGVESSVTYSYTVTATNSAGMTGGAAAQATALVPIDDVAPSAVLGLRAVTSREAGQLIVRLAWDAASDEHGVKAYRVYRSTTGPSPAESELIATVTGLLFQDPNVQGAETYSYRVAAIDWSDHQGPLSSEVVVDMPVLQEIRGWDFDAGVGCQDTEGWTGTTTVAGYTAALPSPLPTWHLDDFHSASAPCAWFATVGKGATPLIPLYGGSSLTTETYYDLDSPADDCIVVPSSAISTSVNIRAAGDLARLEIFARPCNGQDYILLGAVEDPTGSLNEFPAFIDVASNVPLSIVDGGFQVRIRLTSRLASDSISPNVSGESLIGVDSFQVVAEALRSA